MLTCFNSKMSLCVSLSVEKDFEEVLLDWMRSCDKSWSLEAAEVKRVSRKEITFKWRVFLQDSWVYWIELSGFIILSFAFLWIFLTVSPQVGGASVLWWIAIALASCWNGSYGVPARVGYKCVQAHLNANANVWKTSKCKCKCKCSLLSRHLNANANVWKVLKCKCKWAILWNI